MCWLPSRLCFIEPGATVRRAAANIVVRWKKNLQSPLETDADLLKQVAQSKLIDHTQFFDNQALALRRNPNGKLIGPGSISANPRLFGR